MQGWLHGLYFRFNELRNLEYIGEIMNDLETLGKIIIDAGAHASDRSENDSLGWSIVARSTGRSLTNPSPTAVTTIQFQFCPNFTFEEK